MLKKSASAVVVMAVCWALAAVPASALDLEAFEKNLTEETLDNGLLDEYAARVAARQVDPYSVVDEVMRKAGL